MIYLFHFLCMRSNKSSDSSGSNVVITNIANIGRTKRKKGLFELLTCLWSIFWSLEIQHPYSTSHAFWTTQKNFSLVSLWETWLLPFYFKISRCDRVSENCTPFSKHSDGLREDSAMFSNQLRISKWAQGVWFSKNLCEGLTSEHKQRHMNTKGERKHLISFFFSFTALAILCHECAPNFSNGEMCGNPTGTINCTDPSHDSCLSISITGFTGNTSGTAESTFHSLNCTTRLLCNEIANNLTCDLLKKETNAAGLELENCEISCCFGDLCNIPSGGPWDGSFPQDIPQPIPSGSITIKMSMGSTNLALNCALFGILGVIPLATMNIFWIICWS